MRLENCIRRWLGLKAHRVVTIREIAGELIAEIQPLRGRMPRAQTGCSGAGGIPGPPGGWSPHGDKMSAKDELTLPQPIPLGPDFGGTRRGTLRGARGETQ